MNDRHVIESSEDLTLNMKWFYLKRMNKNEKVHMIIPFKKDEVLVGRGKDCTYLIPDESISRLHALFKNNGGFWTIKNLSTNGLYLNNMAISKDEEKILEPGNIINLGYGDKYCFRFGMKEKVKKHKETHKIPGGSSSKILSSEESALDERLKQLEDSKEALLKEKKSILNSMEEEKDLLQQRFAQEQKDLENKMSEGLLAQQIVVKEKEALAERLKHEVEEIQKRHEEEKLLLERKLQEEEETKAKIITEKEELTKRLEVEKEQMEKQLVEERRLLEEKLALEREQLEKRFLLLEEERSHLVKEVHDREQSLKLKEKEKEEMKEECLKEAESLKKEQEKRLKEAEYLKEEREKLMQQLRQVEESLEEKEMLTCTLAGELSDKKELDKRMEELKKDKQKLEEDLKQATERGAKIVDLENALSLLEAQKLSLEQEVASTASISEAARKQVVETVSDVVENEFQCPICSELFINAVMLGCSHTFCKYCIDSWKKTKKECPNCRSPIVSETKSIVVDNFIDKIVSTLSDEMKSQRQKLIEERMSEVKAAEAAETARREAAAAQRNARSTRGRRQNTGARGRGRGRGYTTRSNSRTSHTETTRSNSRNSHIETTRSNSRNSQNETTRSNSQNEASSSSATSRSVASVSSLVASVPVITLPDINPSVSAPSNDTRPLPITISDDESASVDSEMENSYDSDSSSMSGDSGVYYGGYGRCFNCGMRGHWANGCPNNW